MLIVTLFLLPFLLPGMVCAEKDTQPPLTPIRVQLLWQHQFEFAGFYAAIEQGFYQAEGLAVSLQESSGALSPVDEVVSGRAHYGVGNADLLMSRSRGQPVVMLANLFKHSPLVILTRRDSGIRRPQDLIGKRLMTRSADMNSAEIRFMLDQESIAPEQLQLVAHSYGIDELASQQVDAMTAYITNQPFELQERGVDLAILDPANYGADFYSNNLFTSEQELQAHPERVAAFRRATLRGWQYALAHPMEVVNLIYRQYSQRKSLSALHYEAREVEKLIAEEVHPLGSIDMARLERLQEVYMRVGMLHRPVDLASFVWQPQSALHGILSLPQLNAAEQAFIEQHSEVRVCTYQGWLPYEGVENNRHIGIAADVLRYAAQTVGLRVREVPYGSWSEALQGLKDKQCDLLSGVVKSKERQAALAFTQDYINITSAVVTRRSQPFVSEFSELSGKKLGVISGGVHEELLVTQYPDIKVEGYRSIEQGLSALSRGQVDGFVDAIATTGFYIRRLGLDNLHIAGHFPHKIALSIAVRPDLPDLLPLLDKALTALPERKLHQITRHWIDVTTMYAIDDRVMWRAAAVAIALLSAFVLFYNRLRRMNQELAQEVGQRRQAEAQMRTLNNELLEKNQQLETLSSTDVLTGLRNRYAIENSLADRISNSVTQGEPLSILLLDIDHFKAVNDRFGHNLGDQVLRELALILQQQEREHRVVGRWGGEEFLIVLPDTSDVAARVIAE